MAQGSGSAALGLALLCLLIHNQIAESVVYTVGDNSGWTFGVSGWASGKKFRAGDVLVFKYSPSIHNVVAVPAAGYSQCAAPRGARLFSSGSDRVTLAKGTNYFICSIAGHCNGGLKIAITAA